jgi:hypothetical protein
MVRSMLAAALELPIAAVVLTSSTRASALSAPQAAARAPTSPTTTADPGDHPAPNSVYAEGLGAAIFYSVNYERVIADRVGVRGGFAYFSVTPTANDPTQSASASFSWVAIPLTASYFGIRSGRHSVELGGGATFLLVSGKANEGGISASSAGVLPFGVAMIGYRFHPVDHAGFQFRIGFNALIGNGIGLQDPQPSKLGYIPFPYLSLGASF